MIKVDHLTKSFGSVKAVDDLSFEIMPGEIVGFLGPNGAGKTTTMRIITGFLSPDSGSVSFGETSAQNEKASPVRIGYLPENNPLYKNMMVSEFLELSASLKGITKAKRKKAFDFAVSATRIDDVFYRPLRELSKGYKQRVGMAAALLAEPDILIMDEPTEGLDPNQRSEIRQLIKKLAENHTIIMSTHVMQEAQAVCSRLLIINNGKIIADGTSQSLSEQAVKEQVIDIDIEGQGLEQALGSLPGVEFTVIKKLPGQRLEVRLSTTSKQRLEPEISKLAGQNGWVIWKLAPQEHSLEDIFHVLTAKEKNV